MEEEETVPQLVALVLHNFTLLTGIAAVALLFFAYREFSGRDLSKFVRWAIFGVLTIALVHAFGTAAAMFPELEEWDFYVEHVLSALGFFFIILSAKELYALSEKVGTG